jgi:hypothetical protein
LGMECALTCNFFFATNMALTALGWRTSKKPKRQSGSLPKNVRNGKSLLTTKNI